MHRLATLIAAIAVLAVACGSAETVSKTMSESQATELRTGREAILANQAEGKPYVLWYWGAH